MTALLHSGDHRHFRRLMEEFGAAVRGVALPFAADDDDLKDLCQEVWTRIYERRRSYRGTGPVGAWILVIARRTCVSHARRVGCGRRAAVLLAGEAAPSGVNGSRTPETEFVDNERRRLLLDALGDLPDRQRLAIMMRLLQGCEPEETSTIMGCKQATVRSLLREGLAKLRGSLDRRIL